MRYSFFICFAFFIGDCKDKAPEVGAISFEKLNAMSSFDEISVTEYIQLASSVKELKSIFAERDTTFSIFRESIRNDFSKPVITIDGDKDFVKWMSKDELEYLFELKNSTQPSLHITNSYSAFADSTLSSVGKEVKFLLELYKGNKLMDSNGL